MMAQCAHCTEQRDMVALFGEEDDTDIEQAIDAWHDRQHPEPGPFLASPTWADGRRRGTDEALDATAFDVAPDEVLCPECWLVHRPGRCDR